ncbi:YbgC/FadM family acyl-CoA thioesterase [Sphingomonas gilva]|uniref:YbgC/FadM family acyl-CoA thioesterase n=1 Tax=Sphingomonas gilva TaxID=2305907 RepID=A0A396RTT3_9SPHN|nr:YbgC/FadM family acyl-CoA thioesterase [Sphingomonas gilva]RHW18822.1 YbgC/FadM family acyl-CoA thioesterase [Sphingomonas gilva]
MQDQPATGRLDGATHRFPVRVYFEDTDLSGMVYHANYLRFMERARSDFLRCVGIDQRGALDAGEGVYAVADLAIRFVAPAKLDDALMVVSRVTKVRAAAAVIHQTVMREAEKLAVAEVTAAFLTPGGRPRRQPRAWIEAFERLIEG